MQLILEQYRLVLISSFIINFASVMTLYIVNKEQKTSYDTYIRSQLFKMNY